MHDLEHIVYDINDAVKCELLNMLPNDVSVYQHIATQAWTSTGKGEFRTMEDAERLVKNLIKLGHNQPLESVVFNFLITCPVYIATQWRTHRIQSCVQASARYGNISWKCWRSLDEQDNIDVNNILKRKKKRHEDKQLVPDEERTALPQGMITSIKVTINLWSLINVFNKRHKKSADPMFYELTRKIYQCLPQDACEIIDRSFI